MNPYLNAVLAAGYIVGIVFVIQAFTSIQAIQSTLFIPIGMLGLFVLSAAVMSFLFGYQPFHLYFENRKQEALGFFLRTLGLFAVLVFLYFAYLFFFFPR